MANRLCGNNVNVLTTMANDATGRRFPSSATAGGALPSFTNTAKLPIDTVKRLIAAVAARPNLWIRNHNGQRRGEISLLWQEVSKEVHLPVDTCRIKWGHLRDNFRKIFIRNKISGETPTTWRFYNDMIFMEAAVAENVLRQHRYKDVHRLLNDDDQLFEPTKQLFPNSNVPICELRENFDREALQPYNFPPFRFTDFFNETQRQTKRIKLEAQGFELSVEQQAEIEHRSIQDKMSNEFHPTATTEADEDDDEFDEDAATEENEPESSAGPNEEKNKTADDLFTIEVFDDEEEEEQKLNSSKTQSSIASTESDSKISLSCKNMPTEPIAHNSNHSETIEPDADRMFLLSLLPYLKNIDAKRKLHVRQKLQSVLIDELG